MTVKADQPYRGLPDLVRDRYLEIMNGLSRKLPDGTIIKIGGIQGMRKTDIDVARSLVNNQKVASAWVTLGNLV